MLAKLLFGIYVLYCFEVGLFLIVFPWMDFWQNNLLLEYLPVLKIILLNNFFRGAVTGLGIANLILGAWELAGLRRNFRKKQV